MLTNLTNKLTIIVPSVSNGQLIEDGKRSEAIRSVATFLCNLGGGATQTQGTGYWQSERDGLVQEAVTLISTFFAGDVVMAQKQAEVLLRDLKDLLEQEAMAFELNNALLLI